MNKNKISVAFALFLMFAMVSSLVALPATPPPYAKAQSTSGTTISQNLINDIYAAPAGNDSRSFAAIGPGPTTNNILWTAHIPGVTVPSVSTMTAFGGYVFVANSTDTIALDGGTGNIVYTIPTAGTVILLGLPAGAPEYLGGNYMLLGQNCYTVDTGTLVWTGPPGFNLGPFGYGQILISGGGAPVTDPQYLPAPMFFTENCAWKLTDPAKPPTLVWNDTGKEGIALPTTSVLGTQASNPSGIVYGDGVIVYGDSADQSYSGINATTGAYLWTVRFPSLQFCGATSINGVFAVGTEDGWIYAWNITTGQFMWKWNPGTIDSDWSWSLGSSYGMIYGHNQDGHFYAVNATTGKPVWDAYTNNGVAYSGTFTIAGGYIYAEMGDNQYRNPFTGEFGHSEFDCFDAYNGTLIWSLPLETGAPDNAQCVAYGNLYMIPTTSSSTPGVFTYSTVTGPLGALAGGIGLLNEVVCVGSGPAQSWPMYMNDATHDSSGVGPTSLKVLWSKPLGTGAPFASSPVFANSVGYIGSTDKNLYAFNASNGDVIWNFATKAPIDSTPAVVNGYVYTGADDGNVYCLDATSGRLVWSTPLPAGPAANQGFGTQGTVGPPSPMVVGNNLYIGDNNYLYCLSTSNGAVSWEYTWGSAFLYGTPTIVNNVVFIAPNQGNGSLASLSTNTHDGFLYEINAQTGALIENITIPYVENPFIAAGNPAAYISGEGILAPVTVDSDDNIAFVQQINMRTNAVDLTSGKILWTYDAFYDPGYAGQWGVDNVAGVLFNAGHVYFNEWYNLVCLDAVTGNLTWSVYLNRESMNPITMYGGKLYDTTYFFQVYVINAATGAKESYLPCGNEPTTPTPYAGNLYVASGNFNITCYTQAPLTMGPTVVSTEMTLNVSSNTVTKGNVVYITGHISNVNSPVNATVTVDNPDSTYVNIPVLADANGNFIVDYVPDTAGQLTLSASWNGDALHTAACSNTVSLTVVEPTPTPPPAAQAPVGTYFIVSTIATIVAIAIAVVIIVRKR
jgi:outer membrane protein assembly factor BamB